MAVHATRSAAQLTRVMADLQCTSDLLLEKNGSLEARLVTADRLPFYFIFQCVLCLVGLILYNCMHHIWHVSRTHLPFSSNWQHLSYDVCLEERREIIRTVYVVLCTRAVHSHKHTYVSRSYSFVAWVCHTGPISLCVDLLVFMCLYLAGKKPREKFWKHDMNIGLLWCLAAVGAEMGLKSWNCTVICL